jgi:DNA-binding LacI/PurR family transcriptional regulator
VRRRAPLTLVGTPHTIARVTGWSDGARPTIKDVARAVGVSHTTVSRVMNGARRVAPATRARIEQAARELGYAPNGLARGLVSRSSRVIGLVASDITNPYIAELARAIHRVADDEGYLVEICVTDYDVARELRALDMLVQRRIDGLLLTPPRRAQVDERVRALADRGLPVVAIGRAIDHPRVAVVTSDTRGGLYQAANHLIELGHRRIAFLTGSERTGLGYGKIEGYRAAMADAGLELGDDLVVGTDQGVADGYLSMRLLLRRDPRPTGVLCVTDPVAIGAMGAIEAAGLAIPADVSVIGFDDIAYAAHVHPPLTTVRQPMEELGRLGARTLFDMMRAPGASDPFRTVLACSLVIRGSSGPAPG